MLFDRGSIGDMGLWVEGNTSQHIAVMDKRVQRILAIEAKAGNGGEKLDGLKIRVHWEYQKYKVKC